MLPPPESSKSRHSKQLKPPDDNYAKPANNSSSSAIESISVKHKAAKVPPANAENWLNSSDVMTLREKSNQIAAAAAAAAAATCNENNRNGIKVTSASVVSPTSEGIISGIGGNGSTATTDDSLMHAGTTVTIASSSSSALAGGGGGATITSSSSSSAVHYIDAFSDLDPLGTGKIRPYIDKKYFFQDLKNPPKKVLKDLSDRDGFSALFLSDHNKNATSTEYSMFHDKTIADNTKQNEPSDEFVAQFAATSSTQIFSPNNNGTHGTPPNLSRSTESSKNFNILDISHVIERILTRVRFF